MNQALLQRRKDSEKVLTTGQVARICHVAPRTVSKWFDTGQLRGYRIPGSRDRRIPLEHLVRFMKLHNLPLNGLDVGPARVLLIHGDVEIAATIARQLGHSGFDARAAVNGLEAGLLVERFRPHVIVLDLASPQVNALQLANTIRREPQLADVKLAALGRDPDSPGPDLPQGPRRTFDGRLESPYTVHQLIDLLNRLLESQR